MFPVSLSRGSPPLREIHNYLRNTRTFSIRRTIIHILRFQILFLNELYADNRRPDGYNDTSERVDCTGEFRWRDSRLNS